MRLPPKAPTGNKEQTHLQSEKLNIDEEVVNSSAKSVKSKRRMSNKGK